MIGTELVIWLSSFFKPLLRLHHDIGGRWLVFLWNLLTLRSYRKKHPRGRVDLHDVWNSDDMAKIGMYPLPQEIEYVNPKMNKAEHLFIYGSNTGERTTIEVSFKRRPLPPSSGQFDPPQEQVEVKFKLDDGKGNVYWMEENEVRDFNPVEYRAAGFAFEQYEGIKTGRIKFRGYLKKDNEPKLYYVQIRFLCLFFTKTFDHQRQFDSNFMAKELSTVSIGSVEDLLEDKIEQFCQIKGTFKIDSEEEEELFYLGTVGRRFEPESGILPRKVLKLNGFSKEGHGFQLGLVHSGKYSYRYGFMSKNGKNFNLLEDISLSKNEFESFKSEQTIAFVAKFTNDPISYRFGVRKLSDNKRLVKVEGTDGIAFVEEQQFVKTEKMIERTNNLSDDKLRDTLVVSLEDECAQVVELTGGKGASLAQLKQLSNGYKWTVPNALVVTTSAFVVQTKFMKLFQSKLKDLEYKVKSKSEVEKACNEFVSWFAYHQLEENIAKEIEKRIKCQFGNNWQDKSFAVRSSAAMEDSSEMSAAGQMSTFLGVRGLANIHRAVVKCWASQFGFVPIEYKRGYGQELNSPMAVVIQEMVDCDSAGVIFTANPTDGDERILTVTSNFGLGESVVSASADPDTFQLAVKVNENSYKVDRTVESIIGKTLGKKSLVTRLNQQIQESNNIENFVLNEQTDDGSHKQSLSDEDVIKLGNIALKIQQHYGNPRDIEWGMKNGSFYIFQSRPITNLDSTFTNYELMHEIDTPHMSEFEVYSRAHWGENFPGSSSWLSTFFFLNGATFMRAQIKMGMFTEDEFNPYTPIMGFMYNQLMFNLKSGPFKNMFNGYPKSAKAVASVFAFFGRHITDPDVLEIFKTAGADEKPPSWKMKIGMPVMMVYMLFFVKYQIASLKKKMFEENFGDIATPLKNVPLKDKFNFIYNCIVNASGLSPHRFASFGSSLKSMFLMKILQSSSTDFAQVQQDQNLLTSHCNDVVSAEVPNMLRTIAQAIKDKETFVQLSDEEALEVLKSKSSNEMKAEQFFAEFIRKHGHRGYREMDPLHQPWRVNPIPCIQVIKSLLQSGASLEPKQEKSIDQLMAEIQTPLSWFKRALIQYWLLPWCRDAVGYRENTKSLLVKNNDNIRKALWQTAEEMVKEGILPEADLMFYMKISEIARLTSGERNPLFVMKARQRKRLYPQMNNFKFDEFVKGFRMRPRPAKKEIIHVASDSVCMKGTAVTVGDIKARVCVAETIEEAINIQQGDILLTYSTDIGWSPYFPLISGIVTEIGGTVSHGSVIAREYGIPCLIAVEDVCQYFKTGDIAYLDTKTGTIVKVQE